MSDERDSGYDCDPEDDGRDIFDCGHRGFEEESTVRDSKTYCVNCSLDFLAKNPDSTHSERPEETGGAENFEHDGPEHDEQLS